MLLSALSYDQRVLLWLVGAVASGLWLWFWAHSRPSPPGWQRFPPALPLLAVNALLPLLFDSDSETVTVLVVFIGTSALATFKLLAWVLGRGSLALPGLTRAQFIAVYVLPITPAEDAPPTNGPADGGAQDAEDTQGKQKRRTRGDAPKAQPASVFVLLALLKIATLIAVMPGYLLFGSRLPRYPRIVVEGIMQYCSLSLSMDLSAAFAAGVLHMRIAKHFDNPYASTSAADFWNRRWNQTVSSALRALLYDPLMDGRLVRAPGHTARFSRARRAVGIVATFLVSGIAHEVLFWYVAGHFTPRLLWLSYFVGWGVIVVAENVGKTILRSRRIVVPTWLAWSVTMVAVHVMLAIFWWPPAEDARIPEKAAQHAVDWWKEIEAALVHRGLLSHTD